MIVEFSHSVAAPAEKVYAALMDPDVVRRCIDGLESMTPAGENTYDIRAKGGLKGRVQLLAAVLHESMTLTLEGKSLAGSLKASVRIDLVRCESRTDVRGTGEVTVGGFLVALGPKVLESGARKAVADFVSKLSAQLTSSGS